MTFFAKKRQIVKNIWQHCVVRFPRRSKVNLSKSRKSANVNFSVKLLAFKKNRKSSIAILFCLVKFFQEIWRKMLWKITWKPNSKGKIYVKTTIWRDFSRVLEKFSRNGVSLKEIHEVFGQKLWRFYVKSSFWRENL